MAHLIESASRAWEKSTKWNRLQQRKDRRAWASKFIPWVDFLWLKQDFSSPKERERLTLKYKMIRNEYHALESQRDDLEIRVEEKGRESQAIEEEMRQAGMSEKEIQKAWIYR